MPNGDQSPRPRYFLHVGTAVVPLYNGTTLLGRDPRCEVLLSYAGVSRRHASIVVTGDRVQIADLGSRTGVLVNGMMIEGPHRLMPGDELMVGGHVLKLRAGDLSDENGENERETIVSSHDLSAPGPLVLFETCGQVFQQAFAANLTGPALVAVRVLLDQMQKACEAGSPIPPEAVTTVATHVLRVAIATLDGSWLDAMFRIYRARANVLPLEVIDGLYDLLRRVEIDVATFHDYLRVLDQSRAELTPSERFALRRTEGLLGVVHH